MEENYVANSPLRKEIRAMTSPLLSLPVCSICKQLVRLETAKTDENGQPVHEDCYLQRLMASLQYPPPPHHAEQQRSVRTQQEASSGRVGGEIRPYHKRALFLRLFGRF